ncbi:MAG: hypothetical protein ABSH38_09700 [Verrucomicrobiota bacterium]
MLEWAKTTDGTNGTNERPAGGAAGAIPALPDVMSISSMDVVTQSYGCWQGYVSRKEDLTAENAKSAKRRGYGVFARNPESFRGAIRGLNPELIEKAGERYWREIDRYAELSEFVGEACRHLRRSQRRRTLIRAFWQQAELSL